MKKFARIIALLSCLCLTLATFGGCTSTKDENDIDEKTTVLQAAGSDISYGMYRYFFLNYKSAYSKEEIEANAENIYADIEKNAIESCKSVAVVLSIAREYGILPTDSQIQADIENTIASIKEQYIDEKSDKKGEKGYALQLSQNYMTDTVLRTLIAVDLCESALYTKMLEEAVHLTADDEVISPILYGDEFIRVVQIYIDAGNGKDPETNRRDAQSLLEKLRAGADFDKLVGDYSNDYTMTPDGYYINRGYMSEEFENVAFSLAVGQISEVLELEDGFHIIKRLDKDAEYIEKNYEKLKDQYLYCKFYDYIDERAATVECSRADIFGEIDPALISLK